jgi:hypothetical protein
MAIVGRKRMTRDEALKILEISEWASRDEIEAAYVCIKQRFQAKRAGLSRINCLLSEAKRILVNDADPASANRPGRIALQLGSWSEFREWLAGVSALSRSARKIPGFSRKHS